MTRPHTKSEGQMERLGFLARQFTFLLFIFWNGLCHGSSIGDWTIDLSEDNVISAKTTNESGALLMYGCVTRLDSCMWVVNIGLTCQGDMDTPSLLSSSSGALNLNLHCFITDGKTTSTLYIIDPHDAFSRIARESAKATIVVPTESDQFKVLRFSLKGSAAAMDLVEKALEKKKLNLQNSTKDTYL